MCSPDEGSPTSTSPASIPRAVEHLRPLDQADDEADELVVPRLVEAGHLGGLAAEQRAAVLPAAGGDAATTAPPSSRLEHAGRQVVQEEERLGALHQDVVDAVVDQVAADRGVVAGHLRHHQLGADPVGGGDEDRLGHPPELGPEQAAEAADLGEHAGGEGGLRQLLDAGEPLLLGVDVDAG